MIIKVDYSKLTANEKRDKKISLSSCPSASLFVFISSREVTRIEKNVNHGIIS